MAYDEARGVVVLYGGRKEEPGEWFGDTWEYDGSTWRLAVGYTIYLPYIPKSGSQSLDQ